MLIHQGERSKIANSEFGAIFNFTRGYLLKGTVCTMAAQGLVPMGGREAPARELGRRDARAEQRQKIGCRSRQRGKTQLGLELDQLLAHTPCGFGRVAQANGVQQAAVLKAAAGRGLRCFTGVAGAIGHEDQGGARYQLAQNPAQRLVPRGTGDIQVEVARQPHGTVQIAALTRIFFVRDALRQRCDVSRQGLRDEVFDQERLFDAAHFEYFARLAFGRLRHGCAPVGRECDDLLVGQPHQHRADAGARHAERRGQAIFY